MNKKIQQTLLSNIGRPWKWLADFWGYTAIVIFLIDFFSSQPMRVQSTGVAIIYTAVLVIYISNKEYTRWRREKFISLYNGEIFIALWTLLLLIFIATASIQPEKYAVDATFYTTYITILGLFAITLNSKKLKSRKK